MDAFTSVGPGWDEPQVYIDDGPDGPVPVIACAGELDLSTADELREAAVRLLPLASSAGLVIDLTDVPFSDSRGLATLLTIRRMLRGQPVTLRNPCAQVTATMHMLAIDCLFTMEQTGRATHAR